MGQILRISAFIDQWKKDKGVRTCITAAAVFVSALIQSYALQVFVRSTGIISDGLTGMVVPIERLGELKGLNVPMQIIMLLLNIPVVVLYYKGIGIHFIVSSLVQVFLSSTFLQIFNFSPIFTDEVLNVISEGVIFGGAIIITLRGDVPAGGMSFVALLVSNHTGLSVWSYVFFGNAIMYCLYGAIFNWKHVGYSIIFQFISIRMISAFRHRYELVTLRATTIRGQEVVGAYISHLHHGMPRVEAMGKYSKKKMYLLNTIISAYKVDNATHVMQEVDGHIITDMPGTQQLVGRFYRAPLEQDWE